MIEIRQTEAFSGWIKRLRDRNGASIIVRRIRRMVSGNFGDVSPVGEGVSELRINFGPGYRVYFVQRGAQVVVVLCGGDKSSQDKDIRQAKALAKEIE
jgi:putative addiction module killer protein